MATTENTISYQRLNACNLLLCVFQLFPQPDGINTRIPQILHLLLSLAPAQSCFREILLQAFIFLLKLLNLSRLFAEHFVNRLPVPG